MTDQSIDLPTGAGPEKRFAKREQLVEVGVFFSLIGPSLVYSFSSVDQGNVSFVLTAIETILRDFSLLSLILFFVWRNREAVLGLGWTLRRAWRDILLGMVLFVPVFFGAGLLEQLLTSVGFSSPSTPLPSLEPSRTLFEMLLAVALVIVVALTEETIFRGYLMLRFRAVTGSPFLSLLLAAFIFSLGHGYEGTAGVVTVGAMGLAFGLVFLWRKSLAAPITIHFLQDFVGIMLLPLLMGR